MKCVVIETTLCIYHLKTRITCSLLQTVVVIFSNPNINYINYMKDILYPVIKPLFYVGVLIY